jgi:drug/metabolite transporter (DMT)-like permease
LAAICVLSLGAKDAGRTVAQGNVPAWRVAAGVAAACLSGTAYAILNVVLRYCITRGAPLPTTLFTVSIAGILSLGFISWLRIGYSGMWATTPTQLALMLAAGVCNTVAFMSLTKSLQITSVVYVNALSATQATLAAVAGVLIFREALSPWLALGVGLTITGLMFLAWAHQAMRQAL